MTIVYFNDINKGEFMMYFDIITGVIISCLVLIVMYMLAKKFIKSIILNLSVISQYNIINTSTFTLVDEVERTETSSRYYKVLRFINAFRLTDTSYKKFKIINNFKIKINNKVTDNSHFAMCNIYVNVETPGIYRIGNSPIFFRVSYEKSLLKYEDVVINEPQVKSMGIRGVGITKQEIDLNTNYFNKIRKVTNIFCDVSNYFENNSFEAGVFYIADNNLLIERVRCDYSDINYFIKNISKVDFIKFGSDYLMYEPLKIYSWNKPESIKETFFSKEKIDDEDFNFIEHGLWTHDSNENVDNVLKTKPVLVVEYIQGVFNYYILYTNISRFHKKDHCGQNLI